MQEAQWQAAKSNLVPCKNCDRRFAPDRIAVHERICKSTAKKPQGGAGNGGAGDGPARMSKGGEVDGQTVKVISL